MCSGTGYGIDWGAVAWVLEVLIFIHRPHGVFSVTHEAFTRRIMAPVVRFGVSGLEEIVTDAEEVTQGLWVVEPRKICPGPTVGSITGVHAGGCLKALGELRGGPKMGPDEPADVFSTRRGGDLTTRLA